MGELINREQAVKVCDRALDLFGNQASIVYMVKDAIQHLPTIAQEQKSGRWIHHPECEIDGECGYECSECHMGSDIDYNFCMRCGAKMKR